MQVRADRAEYAAVVRGRQHVDVGQQRAAVADRGGIEVGVHARPRQVAVAEVPGDREDPSAPPSWRSVRVSATLRTRNPIHVAGKVVVVPSGRTAGRSASGGLATATADGSARRPAPVAARGRRPRRSRRAGRRGSRRRRGAASAGRAIVGWWGRARRSSGASGTCRDAGRMTGALRYCAPMARIAALEGVTERSSGRRRCRRCPTAAADPARHGRRRRRRRRVHRPVRGTQGGRARGERGAARGGAPGLGRLDAQRRDVPPGRTSGAQRPHHAHGRERGERLYRESIEAYEHMATLCRGPGRRRLRPVRPRRAGVRTGTRRGLRGRGGGARHRSTCRRTPSPARTSARRSVRTRTSAGSSSSGAGDCTRQADCRPRRARRRPRARPRRGRPCPPRPAPGGWRSVVETSRRRDPRAGRHRRHERLHRTA